MIFQHVGKDNSFLKLIWSPNFVTWPTLVNFVTGDHCKCEQPFVRLLVYIQKNKNMKK